MSAHDSQIAAALVDAATNNYDQDDSPVAVFIDVDGEGMLRDLRAAGWDVVPREPPVNPVC